MKQNWEKITFGKKIFFVDFDFHKHFNHKRKTGRFDFQKPLFLFLDNENERLEESKKYNLYLSLDKKGKEPFFEFDETDRRLYVNYPKFKESCEKSKSSNKNYAKIFFGRDLNLKAALKSQKVSEKQKIILENLDEETVLNWWRVLPGELQNNFLEKINSDFDFSQITDARLLEEIKNRNLKIEDIQSLNSEFEIKKLEDALNIWEENKDHKIENFWQKTFEEKNWILSQIFSRPKVFIEGAPYCGGKSIGNKGGIEGDFLMQNELTENCAFIEIKTPKSEIIHKQYRGKNDGDENTIYSMSDDLTGGITQVINQKESAIIEHGKTQKIRNSKCILIIGNLSSLKDGEKKSFELFRNSNKDVEIITFDELFKRIENLKNILKK